MITNQIDPNIDPMAERLCQGICSINTWMVVTVLLSYLLIRLTRYVGLATILKKYFIEKADIASHGGSL
jgi:hypothetical protein